MEKMKIVATFDKDSKRFHRFVVDEGQEIAGSLYVPKTGTIPDEVAVELRTKNPKRGDD